MNPRIESIFRQARQTLGDKDKDRWSDQDLLDLLDLGHKDYANHAQILRGVVVLPLIPNQEVYKFPPDVFKVLRMEYKNSRLAITSYDEMDELARINALSPNRRNRDWRQSAPNSDFNSELVFAEWQSDTGSEPMAAVIDKSNLDEFRVYPIVDDSNIDAEYDFVNESDAELPYVGAEVLGVTTKIDGYTFNDVFGVVTGLYDPFVAVENFNQQEGVVTGIGESSGAITIRYIKTPDTLKDLDAELLTPRAFDTGLKYYIVGHALRNDLDARNTERGNQELSFYERELKNASDLTEDNAASTAHRQTIYRSGF